MHEVHCRVCKEAFDTDTLGMDKWIMPSTNYYYHVDCYEDWLRNKDDRSPDKNHDDEEWYILLKDYLWKDIKLPNINFSKINSQWKNYLKTNNPKMTAKGIYYAILYYYDYMHGDREKALGGIGIVPSIYSDAAAFWRQLNEKQHGIMDIIKKQKEQEKHLRTIKAQKQEQKITYKYNLDEV